MRVNISGFDGVYQIDWFGNVYRTQWPRNGKLRPIVKNGKRIIKLKNKDGKRKEYTVARMVAKAFLPKPQWADCVRHKDGNRLNDYWENLEWCSKIKAGKKSGYKSRSLRVMKMNRHGEVVARYRSAREAGRQNFMSYQTILDRCNGKVKGRFAPDGYEYVFERCVSM